VPPGRRRELLANLSERVAARRSELRAQSEAHFRRRTSAHDARYESGDLFELFGDDDFGPRQRDTTHPDGAEHAVAALPLEEDDDPVPAPARRIGALAWVLVVAASMLVMCVAAALTFVFFLVRANL